MSSPRPLAGRLVPLRTKDEVRASLETHSVYVVEVPAKFANVIKELGIHSWCTSLISANLGPRQCRASSPPRLQDVGNLSSATRSAVQVPAAASAETVLPAREVPQR